MAVAKIHRHDDARVCGATTVVTNQDHTFAGGKLVASLGDPNSHNNGGLTAVSNFVYVAGKMVCNHTPDSAVADDLCPSGSPHCVPSTASGLDTVLVGDP